MSLAGLVCHLDFSGRCNRRGLLVIAVVLLALQLLLATIVWLAGVPGSHPFVQLLQFVFFWLSLAAAAKRLHDCGLSAWWLLAGALGLMGCCFIVTIAAVALLGPMTLAPGNLGFIVAAPDAGDGPGQPLRSDARRKRLLATPPRPHVRTGRAHACLARDLRSACFASSPALPIH
jgi:uncharacterized membrane protein YhaH (DUF805 family)